MLETNSDVPARKQSLYLLKAATILIRIDSYIFPFEPNPNWSKFYVGGEEIRKYIDDTANKYGLKEGVVFNTKLVKSHWNEERGKWELELERDGVVIPDEAHILINAGGILKLASLFSFLVPWDNADCEKIASGSGPRLKAFTPLRGSFSTVLDGKR